MRNLIAEQPDLEGCLLTLDALHVIGETLDDIRDKGAHHLVSVKDNRCQLRAEALGVLNSLPAKNISAHEDLPKTEHGRTEIRSIRVFPFSSQNPIFSTSKTAMLVRRKVKQVVSGHVSEEEELYVSSLSYRTKSAQDWLSVVRGHWHIENRLHYIKDRTLKEDRCTAQGTTAVNMSTLRSLAVNLLRKAARYTPRAADAFKANAQKAINLVIARSTIPPAPKL